MTLLAVHLGHHASKRVLVAVNVLRRGHVRELACTNLRPGGFHADEAGGGLLTQGHRAIRVSLDIGAAFACGL